MADLDFRQFDVLTFDCYGTLIDWEAGIATGLREILARHGVSAADEDLLEAYAREEAAAEGDHYRRYREILGRALAGVCRGFRVEPTEDEARAFAESVGDWPAFPDSASALTSLGERFKLGVITNCDDDLFARSNARLGV